MTEFIGLAYMAEIPVTIINVQRGGPSTGMPTRTQQADILSCAYASHGDTQHVLLFPEDPHECFEFAAAALDLADRLQTPIFVMTDLDIGMNQRLCAPFHWDAGRAFDRGKVMSAEELEAGARVRPLPGRRRRRHPLPHLSRPRIPTKGGYFTRGTTKDAQARYSEAGPDYLYNVQRLLQKFDTAKALVPQPVLRRAPADRRSARSIFGSTSPAMDEAIAAHARAGIAPGPAAPARVSLPGRVGRVHRRARARVRGRAEPRRARCAACWSTSSASIRPGCVPVLHYDGTPITARFIAAEIGARMGMAKAMPKPAEVTSP